MSARKTRLIGILAATAVVGGVMLFLASRMDLGAYVEMCLAWVREKGAAVFFIAMAVLPFFGFPVSPFIFSAGAVFAPTLGPGVVIVCGVAAVAFNVAVSYWFAARALRPWMERLVAWLGYSVPQLPQGRSVEFILLLRLFPGIPFFVQSYVLGLAGVRFGLYLVLSTLVPSCYIVAAVLAGDALMEGNKGKLALAGGLFAVIGLGLHVLRKRLAAKRALTATNAVERNPT